MKNDTAKLPLKLLYERPSQLKSEKINEFSSEIIETLAVLSTGFLTAWIFYGFTPYTRPNQFEQVIQAFIFTLIGKATLEVEFLTFNCFDVSREWLHSIKEFTFLAPTVNAVLLGFVFAYFANTDTFHRIVRGLKISQETSFPSEWYGVFATQKLFIVLHLKDGRRLYGWPTEWPSDSQNGHFVIQQASWLNDTQNIELDKIDKMLINVTDVRWVEFMKSLAKES